MSKTVAVIDGVNRVKASFACKSSFQIMNDVAIPIVNEICNHAKRLYAWPSRSTYNYGFFEASHLCQFQYKNSNGRALSVNNEGGLDL